MGIEKIPTEKIKLCEYRDRFERHLPDFGDNQVLSETPILVAYSKESDLYFVVKHTGIFQKLVEMGEKVVLCDVQERKDTDEEIQVIRGAYVLDDHIPFGILERAMFVSDCVEELKSKFGTGAFYGNGGKRRGEGFEKESVLQKIRKRVPFKSKEIDVLKRFGGHISTRGIEGLFRLLKGKDENLSFHRINHSNSTLNKQGLREEIDNRIAEMKDENLPEEQIKDEVGLMAYQAIFGEELPEEAPSPNPDDQGDGNGHDPDVGDDWDQNEVAVEEDAPGSGGKKGGGGKNPENDPDAQVVTSAFKAVTEDGIDKLIAAFEAHISDNKECVKFLGDKKRAKKALDENDSEELYEKFSETRISATVVGKEVVIQIGGQVPVIKQ